LKFAENAAASGGQIVKIVMTSKEFTVTEEEFVRATKYYAYKNECLQPEK
jgi:hypothetical protein